MGFRLFRTRLKDDSRIENNSSAYILPIWDMGCS